MATLDDLPRMVSENPQVREDLISTLAAFCQRHGIEAAPEDFIGLAGGDDTTGHALEGSTPSVGSVAVFIYRDGPRYSRWIDTGIVAPGQTQEYR
jgi:hypothetical protein